MDGVAPFSRHNHARGGGLMLRTCLPKEKGEFAYLCVRPLTTETPGINGNAKLGNGTLIKWSVWCRSCILAIPHAPGLNAVAAAEG